MIVMKGILLTQNCPPQKASKPVKFSIFASNVMKKFSRKSPSFLAADSE